MRSRAALNVVLAAVVAAMLWLALRPVSEVQHPVPPVSALDPGRVDRIRIQRPDAAPVQLVRQDGSWRLDAPIRAPADAFRVQALLGLLAAPSPDGFSAAGAELAQYGLAPPRADLHFDDAVLRVGRREPVSTRRYVLDPAADRVHLVADSWFGHIFGDPEAWVDPRPLPEGRAPLAIALPHASWRLEDGRWRRSPPDPEVSADAGVALADAWRRARALSVAALDPTQPWRDEVVITLRGEPAALRLRLAESPGQILLGRPDLGVQYRFLPRQGRVLLARGDGP